MSVTQGAPAALAEPVVPVRRSWIGLLFAANLGLWMAFFTPVQVLLPEQITDLGISGKEAALGWVTALGALVAIIVNPLAGAFSDRTRLRMVRSKPIPFPPEPARWLGIQLTRTALARADSNAGRRNLWLRTLDKVGLGFDS